MELSFFTALTIGFIGSTHCIGMCGGIVGALNSGAPEATQKSLFSQVVFHLTYNMGRIISYCIAGALAGFIGSQSARIPLDVVLPIGGLIAGIFMIALGLYLAGWWRSFAWIENGGQYIWKYIQPLGKRFLPVKTPLHALGLGLVWGWLPCGLVYSALALAILSATPTQGAMLMLGFGIGTLPMLLTMGKGYEYLRGIARNLTIRRVAGVTIMLFGVFTTMTAFSKHNHMHAPTSHAGIGEDALSQLQLAVTLFYESCLTLVQ
ncbi:MAG: sulfite exporter TauE/SafE family protein [Rhodospirillales bacterium]|nr:sulfite exporter TauE/SafE family protein [Rhodospirillales bacterium]